MRQRDGMFRRAAGILRDWLIEEIGPEGVLLIAGTSALAIGASWFGPAWAYIVVGLISILAALAIATGRGR